MGRSSQRPSRRCCDLRTIKADIDGAEVILCNCNLIPENVRLGTTTISWSPNGTSLGPSHPGSSSARRSRTGRCATVNLTTITAFRDGYVDAAGQWPELDLASFAAR